jgi:hypothetical protein
MTRSKDLDSEPAHKPKLVRAPKKAAPEPKSSSAGKKDAGAAGSSSDPDEALGNVIQILVVDVEEQVAKFKAKPGDRQREELPTSAKEITQRLRWATTEIISIKKLNPKLTSAKPDHMVRLSSAMTTLQEMASGGKFRMAENGLERMFDQEDALLHALGRDLRQRAHHYYDEPVVAPGAGSTSATDTPTARAIADKMEDGEAAAAKPTSREGYLSGIQSLVPHKLDTAFKSGLAFAKSMIAAPPPVANPTALEALLGVALAFVSSVAFGALGKAIGAVMFRRPLAIEGGIEKADPAPGLGGLVDGGVAAAAGSIKLMLGESMKRPAAMKPGVAGDVTRSKGGQAPTHAGTEMLSPKDQFILRIEESTNAAVVNARAGIVAQQTTLHRLPTETLAQLYEVLEKGLGDFAKAYGQVLIREWVNFVKAASDAGVMNKSSPLDNLVEPKGVLKIELGVRGTITSLTDASRNKVSGLDVLRVSLPGTTPGMRANLADQPYSLQSIPLHKRIVVSMSDQALPIEFDVTRDYRLEPPKLLSKQQMALLRQIAGFAPSGAPRETYPGQEALPMLQIVFAHLNQVPASRIQ